MDANSPIRPGKASIVETHAIVSTFGYLIGVERCIFESDGEPLQMDTYLELEQNQAARRIRHLSILRTAFENHFSAINNAIWYNMKTLRDLPEYIPHDSLSALEQDGLPIQKVNCKPVNYIMDLNRHIVNHINACRDLFPGWLKWEYIRELFIMPHGNTDKGLKRAASLYQTFGAHYPYQVYLNWPCASNQGNILYNDKKFVTLIYQQHNDRFLDFSKVTDAGADTKSSVYDFLAQCGRAVVIVDCENADPYKVYAMLTSLGQENLLKKVGKIMLYNDVHTSTAWKRLEQFTDIPVEHYMTQRVKPNKSLVDIQLTTGVCQEYYENHTDAFLLISSDSDYWGLIFSMPQIRFLVMIEEAKCSPAAKVVMENNAVAYCSMDNFCTSGSNKLVISSLLGELRKGIQDAFSINIQAMLNRACQSARANLSEDEKQRIYSRYIKPARITFSESGDAVIQFGA